MTNSFLIADESAKQAVLFDAPDHTTGPLLDEATRRGWNLAGLWLTHGHFDHVSAVNEVLAQFPVPVYLHKEDAVFAFSPLNAMGRL